MDFEFTQAKKPVDQLSRKEKEALAPYLDEQTLFDEMHKVQQELKLIRIFGCVFLM